jgi:hypothetical protein
MYSISDIEKLPDVLKKEVLHYAEFIAIRYLHSTRIRRKEKWLSIVDRGTSVGEKASDTVINNRENEKW